jgi:hypothetical protein
MKAKPTTVTRFALHTKHNVDFSPEIHALLGNE